MILIPGDGAAGIRGLKTGPPARRWHIRDACGPYCLNGFLALWSQAYRPPATGRSRRPRSTWPGSATAPHDHAPQSADILSLARAISDRRIGANSSSVICDVAGAQIVQFWRV
jgi:hypothetical protein